jgi:hypothetical protein
VRRFSRDCVQHRGAEIFATSPESSRFAETRSRASDGRSGCTASACIASRLFSLHGALEAVILSDFGVISRWNTLRDDTKEKQVLQQALSEAVQQNSREELSENDRQLSRSRVRSLTC